MISHCCEDLATVVTPSVAGGGLATVVGGGLATVVGGGLATVVGGRLATVVTSYCGD
jgi:hypothetical protein